MDAVPDRYHRLCTSRWQAPHPAVAAALSEPTASSYFVDFSSTPVSEGHLTPDDVECLAIFLSAPLDRPIEVSFASCGLSAEFASSLALLFHSSCTTIDLNGNPAVADGFITRSFSIRPRPSPVNTLLLADCGLAGRHLSAIAASVAAKSITAIDIGGAQITADELTEGLTVMFTVRAECESPPIALSLSAVAAGSATANCVARALKATTASSALLSGLVLENLNLVAADVIPLFLILAGPAGAALSHLSLDQNALGAPNSAMNEYASALAGVMTSCPALEALLVGNQEPEPFLSHEGVCGGPVGVPSSVLTAVAGALPYATNLCELSLAGCSLVDLDAVFAFGSALNLLSSPLDLTLAPAAWSKPGLSAMTASIQSSLYVVALDLGARLEASFVPLTGIQASSSLAGKNAEKADLLSPEEAAALLGAVANNAEAVAFCQAVEAGETHHLPEISTSSQGKILSFLRSLTQQLKSVAKLSHERHPESPASRADLQLLASLPSLLGSEVSSSDDHTDLNPTTTASFVPFIPQLTAALRTYAGRKPLLSSRTATHPAKHHEDAVDAEDPEDAVDAEDPDVLYPTRDPRTMGIAHDASCANAPTSPPATFPSPPQSAERQVSAQVKASPALSVDAEHMSALASMVDRLAVRMDALEIENEKLRNDNKTALRAQGAVLARVTDAAVAIEALNIRLDRLEPLVHTSASVLATVKPSLDSLSLLLDDLRASQADIADQLAAVPDVSDPSIVLTVLADAAAEQQRQQQDAGASADVQASLSDAGVSAPSSNLPFVTPAAMETVASELRDLLDEAVAEFVRSEAELRSEFESSAASPTRGSTGPSDSVTGVVLEAVASHGDVLEDVTQRLASLEAIAASDELSALRARMTALEGLVKQEQEASIQALLSLQRRLQ
jgi:hypothetical protein